MQLFQVHLFVWLNRTRRTNWCRNWNGSVDASEPVSQWTLVQSTSQCFFFVQQMLCNAWRCDAIWVNKKQTKLLFERTWTKQNYHFDDNICKNLPIKWAHCCCAVWKSMNSKMTPTGHCFSGFAHGLATILFTFCFIRVFLCAGSAWHSSQFERQTTTNANC